MTNKEFSDEFDVMLNSYDNLPFRIVLDEYEKSVFLTQAQDSLIRDIYIAEGAGFESKEFNRRALSNLVCEFSEVPTSSNNISSNSQVINLPNDVLYILIEWADTSKNINIEVVPVTMDEYHRIKNNPFRGTTDKRILRLDSEDSIVLISKNEITKYYCKYLKKPNPIILIDLPDGLKINEESEESICELDSSLHRDILNIAVQLAVRSKTIGLSNNNSNKKETQE